ncbi:MAG: hypothetical protein WC464_04950 [Bdellovibrionales bacterium]
MYNVKKLDELADNINGDPVKAFDALIALGFLYESGNEGIPNDWEKALSNYERATHINTPEVNREQAFLSISRLCHKMCLATDDNLPDLKESFATYCREKCPVNLVTKCGNPEIALFVGEICEHMAEYYLNGSSPSRPNAVREYYAYAMLYYVHALEMNSETSTIDCHLLDDKCKAMQARLILLKSTTKNTASPHSKI